MKTQRTVLLSLLISMFMMTLAGQIYAVTSVTALKKKLVVLVNQNSKATAKTKKFINSNLLLQLSNPVFVKAIKKQNARGISMAVITKIDNEWKDAEDELEIHDEMMSGVCADEVRKLVKKWKVVGETFVTDNQGANVCQNELTGDYWQGDEAKWKNAFDGGQGGVDIGTAKLDRSSNMILQQVSLPVVDKGGVVIGAITYGLKVERL